MKKINYYLGAMALATLGLAACSDNNLPGDDLGRTDIERDMYINIAIHGDNPTGSRAAVDDGQPGASDFADGEGLESDVSNVYLVFYDAVGNVVGDVVTASPEWGVVSSENASVENVGTQTLKVTLAVGQQQPSFVMCYINPTSKDNLLKPLNDLATTSVQTVQNPGGTFPMSNSVYFDAGGNTVTATPIAGKYYTTKELADEAAKQGESVDIYVERYASKLEMKALGTINDYKTGTMPLEALQGVQGAKMLDVTLTFTATGWEVNGVSDNTYVIKSFRKESDNGQVLPDVFTLSELNNRINASTYTKNADGSFTYGTPLTGTDSWTWNAPDYYRSYWACSPVYFQSEYPEVSSDYNAATMAQTFYSYEAITKNVKVFGGTYYFPETTVGPRGLFSANPNAAVASVVVVGEYSVTVGDTEVPAQSTFYTYVPVNIQVGETPNDTEQHPSVYFDVKNDGNTIGTSAVDGTLSMQNRLLWQNTVLYQNVDGKNVRYDMNQNPDVETLVGNTEIARPKDTVLAMAVVGEGTVKMAERTRTLQLKTEAINKILINDNGVIKSIVANDQTPTETQVTLDRANLILWQNVGTCNKYDGGAGFFNIPVKHLGWYRGGNEQKTADKIDFAKVRVGDLGMVRNHSYSVSVSSITGLASGIGSQTTPIIPPADTQDVYVAYKVNVLQWAVVPAQDIKL